MSTKRRNAETGGSVGSTPHSAKMFPQMWQRKFLEIFDFCFPVGHRLRSTLNRNTVKVSYCTMPNMAQMISRHNQKLLVPKETLDKECNCRNKNSCPLEGKCKTSGVVYQATVTTISIPVKTVYWSSRWPI